MKEPKCDMPWEIYLDWLQDQGNEDLRDIHIGLIFTGYRFMAMAESNQDGSLGRGSVLPYLGSGLDCDGCHGNGGGSVCRSQFNYATELWLGFGAYEGDGI